MSTQVAMLRTSYGASVQPISSEGDFDQLDLRQAEEATGVSRTIDVPESAAQEYQSILPLEGKYANDPTWERFDDFIKELWEDCGDVRGGE